MSSCTCERPSVAGDEAGYRCMKCGKSVEERIDGTFKRNMKSRSNIETYGAEPYAHHRRADRPATLPRPD